MSRMLVGRPVLLGLSRFLLTRREGWWLVPLPDSPCAFTFGFLPWHRSRLTKSHFSSSLSTEIVRPLSISLRNGEQSVCDSQIAEQPWVAVVESRRKTSMLLATMNPSETCHRMAKRMIDKWSRSVFLVPWMEWMSISLPPLCPATQWCSHLKASRCLLLCIITKLVPTRTWTFRKASGFKSLITQTRTGGSRSLWRLTEKVTSQAIM